VATTVITGRDLALTIDSKSYDAQALSVALNTTLDRQAYETLDGRVFKSIDSDATMDLTILADWGASTGAAYSVLIELIVFSDVIGLVVTTPVAVPTA